VEARTAELKEANTQLQQEVKERKKTEEELAQSLKEKEVLLQEIHHRVKNNMQIISSLLRLQSYQIKGEKTSEIFRLCQNRIKSMALIHEKLYQSEDFSKIDFSDYIKSLTENLSSIYQSEAGSVDFKLNLEEVHLNINQAIPLGLIVNELVSNSLKHAFSGRKRKRKTDLDEAEDHIIISLETNRTGEISLSVRDNGVGLPSGFDLKKVDSLGLQLVQDLARQLSGSIEFNSNGGTCFKISFKHKK
ncbi:MAG: sensor histidine kinase, partial [Acidobacteriota bacterium]